MDRLKDKIAIITGANSGIDEATAKLFASDESSAVNGQDLVVDRGGRL